MCVCVYVHTYTTMKFDRFLASLRSLVEEYESSQYNCPLSIIFFFLPDVCNGCGPNTKKSERLSHQGYILVVKMDRSEIRHQIWRFQSTSAIGLLVTCIISEVDCDYNF